MTNNDELARNPVLAYADSYRSMANQGSESVPVWGVITDLERNISPLYAALLAERDADKKRIAELEARTVSVKLPKTIWYEHDDLARDVAVLEKRLVKKVLREACADAGIKLEVGE